MVKSFRNNLSEIIKSSYKCFLLVKYPVNLTKILIMFF